MENQQLAETMQIVLADLREIKRLIGKPTVIPTGEYLTPKEVCTVLKISGGKFYQLVKDGVLHTLKPDPNGRKTYVMRKEVEGIFKKDFATA